MIGEPMMDCPGCPALERQGNAYIQQNKQIMTALEKNTALTQKIYVFLNGELGTEGLVRRVISLEEWVKEKRNHKRQGVAWAFGVFGTIVGMLIVAFLTNLLQFNVRP
jgi:hypothetical protein